MVHYNTFVIRTQRDGITQFQTVLSLQRCSVGRVQLFPATEQYSLLINLHSKCPLGFEWEWTIADHASRSQQAAGTCFCTSEWRLEHSRSVLPCSPMTQSFRSLLGKLFLRQHRCWIRNINNSPLLYTFTYSYVRFLLRCSLDELVSRGHKKKKTVIVWSRSLVIKPTVNTFTHLANISHHYFLNRSTSTFKTHSLLES